VLPIPFECLVYVAYANADLLNSRDKH
jgi:hypothetical protein